MKGYGKSNDYNYHFLIRNKQDKQVYQQSSFISNSAGGNSGNHLVIFINVIFINGTEYKIKLENA